MSEGAVESGLEALAALQETDLRADQLRHQIANHPARAKLAAAASRRAANASARTAAEAARAELAAAERELEQELLRSEERQRAIDERLRSAAAGSFRDQEAMAGELDTLARRSSDLEDRALELMEAIEPYDRSLETIAASDAAIALEEADASAELSAGVAELEAALDELGSARAAAASAVPEPLLADYERLRARLGGIGAARIVHGSCSGCNLALSATEVDRIRHASPGAVFHCEQCGRILIP